MNNYVEQDNRYPEWMKAWNAKAAEIDEQIIDWFQNATNQTAESLENLEDRISNWWDRQDVEESASAEFAKAKADAKLLKAQVANRVEYLKQDGKIAWNNLTRKEEG